MAVCTAVFLRQNLVKWTVDYAEDKESEFGAIADAASIYAGEEAAKATRCG